MFNKLIASAPDHRRWLRNPLVLFVSVTAHIVLLGGIVWASSGEELEAPPEPERITYIDVTEIPPPPMDPEELFEAPPEASEPAPAAAAAPAARPAAAPTPPQRTPPTRTPRPPSAPSAGAPGFSELQIPDVDVSGIPAPNLSAPAARAEDFGGRGTPGGSSSGTSVPVTTVPARGGAPGGSGTGGGGSGGDNSGTFSANLVDEPVQLLNARDVERVLGRRYPPAMREAGIQGRAIVQFVVDRNGRVEPGSIRIISTTRDEFGEPTRAAVSEFRFRPAMRQGQTVRQIVQLPVTWQVDR